jgi:hypothetical protein
MRIQHRMQMVLCAMGAWIAHQRRELTAKVGPFKADVMMGPGRYRAEHPRGAGLKRRHTLAEQRDVGVRAFNRRAVYLRRRGAFLREL